MEGGRLLEPSCAGEVGAHWKLATAVGVAGFRGHLLGLRRGSQCAKVILFLPIQVPLVSLQAFVWPLVQRVWPPLENNTTERYDTLLHTTVKQSCFHSHECMYQECNDNGRAVLIGGSLLYS